MIDTLRRSPLLIALAVAAVVLAALLAFEVRLATPARGTAAPAGARPVDAKLLPPIPARPPGKNSVSKRVRRRHEYVAPSILRSAFCNLNAGSPGLVFSV